MNPEELKEKIRESKPSLKESSQICNQYQLRVKRVVTSNKKTIVSGTEWEKCECCGSTKRKPRVAIYFKDRDSFVNNRLTVLETALLYSLYVFNKNIRDISNYLYCPRAKELLGTIDRIEVE